jgi:hypothetical protein
VAKESPKSCSVVSICTELLQLNALLFKTTIWKGCKGLFHFFLYMQLAEGVNHSYMRFWLYLVGYLWNDSLSNTGDPFFWHFGADLFSFWNVDWTFEGS